MKSNGTRRDARKLSPDAQYEIRRQAVNLHKKGNSFQAIAESLEVDRNTVSQWIAKYQQGGLKALKAQQRGPKVEPRTSSIKPLTSLN